MFVVGFDAVDDAFLFLLPLFVVAVFVFVIFPFLLNENYL